MNKTQNESQRDEPKEKGDADKHGGKQGTVIGEINDDATKKDNENESKPGDASKHGNSNGTVVGDINDDAKKKNK